MAGAFHRELERIEGYWQKRPLLRGYGLWCGLIILLLLISFLPMEVIVQDEIFGYAGSDTGPAGELWRLEEEGTAKRIWRESRTPGPEGQWIVSSSGEAYQALSEDYLMAYPIAVRLEEEEASALWSGNQGNSAQESYSPLELQQMENFGRRSATRLSRCLLLLAVGALGLPFVRLAILPKKRVGARASCAPSEGEAAEEGKTASGETRIRAAWVTLGILAIAACLLVA